MAVTKLTKKAFGCASVYRMRSYVDDLRRTINFSTGEVGKLFYYKTPRRRGLPSCNSI